MRYRGIVLLVLLALFTAAAGWKSYSSSQVANGMTEAARKFVGTLSAEQKPRVVLDYGTEQRVGWHFIPKDTRKGLQIKEMSQPQRDAALELLRSCLSEIGYEKATKIMELEGILRELEKGRDRGPVRDPERYYFTLFGEPDDKQAWGLSVEGHHLSLNFVVEDGEVKSSTPTFLGANPGIVKEAVAGTKIEKGTRVLAKEEILAFKLVKSLNDEQKKKAVIAAKAPREIRAAGEAQPPQDDAVGISYGDLTEEQKSTMRELVTAYANVVPASVQQQRIQAIIGAGPAQVRFAWAGAQEPGVGHYYRIQGPTFLIEFVNTQPDAAGNPANHIHCVWRDMRGDFAIPVQ